MLEGPGIVAAASVGQSLLAHGLALLADVGVGNPLVEREHGAAVILQRRFL